MESHRMLVYALETPNEWGEGTGFFKSPVEAEVEGMKLVMLMNARPQSYVVVGFEVDKLAWEVMNADVEAFAWLGHQAWDNASNHVWASYEDRLNRDEQIANRIAQLSGKES